MKNLTLSITLCLVCSFLGFQNLYAFQSSQPQDSLETLIHTAEELFASGSAENIDSSAVLFKRALTLDPDNIQTLESLTTVHWYQVVLHDRPVALLDSAALYAKKVSLQEPVLGYYLMGRTYGFKGEQAFAIESFEESLRYDSEYLPTILRMGYRFFDMGRHDKGIPLQMKSMEMDPSDMISRTLLGFSYFHLGLPDLGDKPFEEALKIQITEHPVGGPLLLSLVRGDYDRAIAFTDSIWQINSEPAFSWARVGEAYFFDRNWDQAEHFYEEALERDQNSTNQYTWKSTALPLAYIYKESGRDDLAEPMIQLSYVHADQLLKQGQEPWNAYYQYAALALLEGDRDRAIRWLRVTHLSGMPGPVLIESDPLMADLQEDPEFREVVGRLKWREKEIRTRLGY